MTRLELQKLFLQFVNDPSGTFFDPVEFVQPALNRALLELQKQLVMSGDLYYVRSPPSSALSIQYQQDYVLPDDTFKLHRVTVDLDTATPQPAYNTLRPITLNQIDRYGNDVGIPQAYVITKNKISLYPIPQTGNQILRLWYSYQVPQMTADSSVPDCPEIYQEYIAVIAVIDAKIKDESLETNIKEKQMRYQELMKQAATDRQYQEPRQVVCYDEDQWTAY